MFFFYSIKLFLHQSRIKESNSPILILFPVDKECLLGKIRMAHVTMIFAKGGFFQKKKKL